MTRPQDYRSTQDILLNRPRYFKIQKELQERHDLRQKSIQFRRQLLQDRQKSMYQNEFDRLRGEIAHSALPQQTRENIQRRLKEIENFKIA